MTKYQINMVLRAAEDAAIKHKFRPMLVAMMSCGNEYIGYVAWHDNGQTLLMLNQPEVPPLYLDPSFIVGMTLIDPAKEPASV